LLQDTYAYVLNCLAWLTRYSSMWIHLSRNCNARCGKYRQLRSKGRRKKEKADCTELPQLAESVRLATPLARFGKIGRTATNQKVGSSSPPGRTTRQKNPSANAWAKPLRTAFRTWGNFRRPRIPCEVKSLAVQREVSLPDCLQLSPAPVPMQRR
jgi:hypothetical protein